ncbi:MAG: hypothetical protein ACRBN8_45755 [Nannocystales bacterium]
MPLFEAENLELVVGERPRLLNLAIDADSPEPPPESSALFGPLVELATGIDQISLEADWRAAARGVVERLRETTIISPPYLGRSRARSLGFNLQHDLSLEVLRELSSVAQAGASLWVLLRGGTLHWSGSRELLEHLWSLDPIFEIVELPSLFKGNPWLPGSATLIGLGGPEGRPTRSITLVDGDALLGTPRPRAASYLDELRTRCGSSNPLGRDFIWDSPASPLRLEAREMLEVEEQLAAAAGPTARLGDMVDFVPTRRSRPRRPEEQSGKEPQLTGRDLAASEVLERDTLEERALFGDVPDDRRLRAGDIAFPKVSSRHRVRVTVITAALEGVVPSDSVVVLRPHEPTHADFLVDYLQSDFAIEWIGTHAARIRDDIRMSREALLDLPIPQSDATIRSHLKDLRMTADALRGVAQDYERARRATFTVTNIGEQLKVTQRLGVEARLVTDLLQSMHDPLMRAVRTYPLPLAQGIRCRATEVQADRRYKAALDVFESVITYLAALLVADLRADAGSITSTKKLLKTFRRRDRGPSLGDWLGVLRNAPALPEGKVLESSAFPELRLLCTEDDTHEFWTSCTVLSARRNDLAHGRGPRTDLEFERAEADVTPAFERVLESVAFLAGYPLRDVVESSFDALTGRRGVSFRELMGDQPTLPLIQRTAAHEYGQGLHVLGRDGKMILISPWLETGECPVCHQREVAAPESWTAAPEDRMRYKSLTTGHLRTMRSQQLERLCQFVDIPALDPPP